MVHLLGIARCTVCIIVKETCKAIVKQLAPLYVNFPSGDSLKMLLKVSRNVGVSLNVQALLMVVIYLFLHPL